MDIISTNRSFNGTQGVYSHKSDACNCDMTFAVYVPDVAKDTPCPLVWYLSGLTCTHANVMEKGEYRRIASELGLIIVAPDTSPRGENVPNDEAYDFGQGAGFYVDATEEPWAPNFRMRSYIEKELPAIIAANFPADMQRQSIFGHSMGGHGALTIALRSAGRFKSVSAFAPIVSPLACPRGEKALSGYIGDDRNAWREYDACALIEDGARVSDILVDQGSADNFLEEQLKPHLLKDACKAAAIPLTLNMREGHDHSYYFIATYMEDHLRWHKARLG